MINRILILIITLFINLSLQAKDLGWRHVDFWPQGETKFSMDIRLEESQYSFGKTYSTDIWIHLNDSNVKLARAFVKNFVQGLGNLETKSFDLEYNKEKKIFEAPVPYGLGTLTNYNDSYQLQRAYQEVVICVVYQTNNVSTCLKVPNTDSTAFYFNIYELFGI